MYLKYLKWKKHGVAGFKHTNGFIFFWAYYSTPSNQAKWEIVIVIALDCSDLSLELFLQSALNSSGPKFQGFVINFISKFTKHSIHWEHW